MLEAMPFDAFFQFGELASELDVTANHPAELDEGAHDGDVDLNGNQRCLA